MCWQCSAAFSFKINISQILALAGKICLKNLKEAYRQKEKK